MIFQRLSGRFGKPLLLLLAEFLAGAVGYRVIGGPQTSWVDAVYMTFITIATIGFSEVVDLSDKPAGRIFTMAIAAVGIATVTYLMAATTAFVLEGELNEALRRRRMLKRIDSLRGHYIICGLGRVGSNVAQELRATGRDFVAIEVAPGALDEYMQRHGPALVIRADASEDDSLREAGIDRASGVFAVTGEDSKNLVIALSAKALNARVRVVARCHDLNYIEKIRKVGADAIVSPEFTGGMRLASSMIRPHVVNFLDEMLRTQRNYRIEEVTLARSIDSVAQLRLHERECVLLAVQRDGEWLFNPTHDMSLAAGDVLVIMTTPESRQALTEELGAVA